MNKLITLLLCIFCSISSFGKKPILGPTEIEAEKIYQFIKQQNPSFDRTIAENFVAIGPKYGISGDIAICQSIIETGWFKYKGSAVTPDQHNYCGMGVTSNGMKGNSFATVKDGVTAQIQHLYAYCCTKSLPYGETLIDPRFKYVNRGCAPNWEDLGGKWAAGDKNYGVRILDMYNSLKNFKASYISANPTSISFTANQDATSPVSNVTITGKSLSQTITVTSSSDMFTVSKGSNWNNLTGGTLSITMNTSANPGSYSGYVDVKSGNLSSRINISATIKAAPLKFTEYWNLSEQNGNKTSKGYDASDIRNMAYANGKLYTVYGHNKIKVIKAQTGEDLGDLNEEGVGGGILKYCDVQTVGNKIVACNLSNGTSPFKIYVWDDDTQNPRVLLETTDLGGVNRMGDCFNIWGDLNNGTIYLGHDDGKATRIFEYRITNGVCSKTPRVFYATTDGTSYLKVGTSCRVIPQSVGYWINGHNSDLTRLDNSGTRTAVVKNNVVWGNAFSSFEYKGVSYGIMTTFNTPDGVNEHNYTGGRMALLDASKGWSNTTLIGEYPAAGLGSTSRNIYGTGNVIANVCNGGKGLELWVLSTRHGMAYLYTGSCPWDEGVKPIVPPVPPVTTPSISASAETIDFTTTLGVYAEKTVTISGVNLRDDISLSLNGTDSDMFSISQNTISKSSASATVTVTYSPTAAGNHTATLNISSTDAPSIEVSLLGKAENETAEPTEFTTDWCYSAINGASTSWMNPNDEVTRNMALKDNDLYIARKGSEEGNQLVIVDAFSGTKIGALNTAGASISWFGFSSVANMGGTIVACDLATGADNVLSVYAWSSNDAAPQEVLKTANHGGIRIGDVMNASGNINNGKLWFGGKDNKVYVYKVTNGTASTSPVVITLKDSQGKTVSIADGFSIMGIYANNDGTFWATGKGAAPMLFDANGNLIRSLAKSALNNNTFGTSYCPVALGSKTYAVANTYNNGVKGGKLNLINISNGEENAELVHSFPDLGNSSVSNGTFITTAIAIVKNSAIHMWTLIPHQGIAKYTASSITSGCSPESVTDAEISVANGTVSVNSENAVIELISVNGMRVAHSENSMLDINDIQKGIYIVVATLENGERLTKKIAIM